MRNLRLDSCVEVRMTLLTLIWTLLTIDDTLRPKGQEQMCKTMTYHYCWATSCANQNARGMNKGFF